MTTTQARDPEATGDSLATPYQVRVINTALKDAGFTDRDDRLDHIEDLIGGREIDSSAELTYHEADELITSLIRDGLLLRRERGAAGGGEAPELCSEGQRRKLWAGMRRLGINGREASLRVMSEWVGREITSSNKLTRDEASAALDKMMMTEVPASGPRRGSTAPPGEELVTDEQLTGIWKGMKSIGVRSRPGGMRVVEEWVGRDLRTSADLTRDEATNVLAMIRAARRDPMAAEAARNAAGGP
jgi:hypothetical protein